MPIALGEPGVGALVRCGADHGRELGLDEGLVDGLGSLTDAVINLRGRECVQDFDECRLVKGHRALCPFASTIGLVSLTIARCPLEVSNHLDEDLLPTPPDGTPLKDAAAVALANQRRRCCNGWRSATALSAEPVQ
jgi:hypothetical protein